MVEIAIAVEGRPSIKQSRGTPIDGAGSDARAQFVGTRARFESR